MLLYFQNCITFISFLLHKPLPMKLPSPTTISPPPPPSTQTNPWQILKTHSWWLSKFLLLLNKIAMPPIPCHQYHQPKPKSIMHLLLEIGSFDNHNHPIQQKNTHTHRYSVYKDKNINNNNSNVCRMDPMYIRRMNG